MNFIGTFILVIFMALPLSAEEIDVCEVSETSCDFYLCREERQSCGPRAYLKNFGYKYCSRFLSEVSPRMTEQGQVWLGRVGQCLQQALQGRGQESCSQTKRIAVASHSDCYVETGFCELEVKDRTQIYNTIFQELWRPSFFREAVQVLSACD